MLNNTFVSIVYALHINSYSRYYEQIKLKKKIYYVYVCLDEMYFISGTNDVLPQNRAGMRSLSKKMINRRNLVVGFESWSAVQPRPKHPTQIKFPQ